MYEKFKIMQTAAEQIGTIQNIAVHEDDKIWSDGVKISGTTADGSEFDLELTIKAKETAHE